MLHFVTKCNKMSQNKVRFTLFITKYNRELSLDLKFCADVVQTCHKQISKIDRGASHIFGVRSFQSFTCFCYILLHFVTKCNKNHKNKVIFTMKVYEITTNQIIDRPIAEVFAFFLAQIVKSIEFKKIFFWPK